MGLLETRGKAEMNTLQHPLNLTVSMETSSANKVNKVVPGVGRARQVPVGMPEMQLITTLVFHLFVFGFVLLFFHFSTKVSQGLKSLGALQLFPVLELNSRGDRAAGRMG